MQLDAIYRQVKVAGKEKISPMAKSPTYSHPLLADPRFQEPAGWRWHTFTTTQGHKLRCGSVHPKDSIADAVVVCLPGLRDFAEQYFETAHNMLQKNMAFWVIDWRGQGESDRYLSNRHKRHSGGYDQDIADLYQLVDGYILPSAVHPEVGRLPLVMLAHSMGAHLGLRFLHDCNVSSKGKQAFSAGFLCSPMFGVSALDFLSLRMSWLVALLLCVFPRGYVPKYGGNWKTGYRALPQNAGKFSHDPIRLQLQEAWFAEKPSLQTGGPTNRWLLETIKSCLKLNSKKYLKEIELPVHLAMAGNDRIVNNKLIERAANILPTATLDNFPGAEHELLMESDQYRQPLLDHFFSFIEKNVLKKSNRGKTTF